MDCVSSLLDAHMDRALTAATTIRRAARESRPGLPSSEGSSVPFSRGHQMRDVARGADAGTVATVDIALASAVG